MDTEIAVKAIRWAFGLNSGRHSPRKPLKVSFHGGEPLLAGEDFFRAVFRGWNRLALGDVNFEIQSNLWLLTEELCRLFGQQRTIIGTSLDGPREICDAQRGLGYFDRTMRGIELAKLYSPEISCIATITPQSQRNVEDVLGFFVKAHQDFNVYGAVPGLLETGQKREWTLSPEQYRATMIRLFDQYLSVVDQIRIESFDRFCRALHTGKHPTCLFSDCFGEYFAVDHGGWIYPCVRCVGEPSFRYGNIKDAPSVEEMAKSPSWRRWSIRRDRVREECAGCVFWPICMGGCACNWEIIGNAVSFRDPYCFAYRGLYQHLLESAIEQVGSDANREKLHSRSFVAVNGLLQSGTVLELISGQRHPARNVAAYRRIVAAAALGTGQKHHDLAEAMVLLGVARTVESAETSLGHLLDELKEPRSPANDCHLHVTDRCSVGCKHCFASSAVSPQNQAISPEKVCTIVLEASHLQFRRVVLSGGEPLEHPLRDKLLHGLAAIRRRTGACFLVLRTSLVPHVDVQLARLLQRAVDQVVVSLDGSRDSHDARRFRGAYDRTFKNLKVLLDNRGELVVRLATLVDGSSAGQDQANVVRTLARTLDIESVVVRQPKPLGRALEWIDWEHQNLTNVSYPEAILRGMYPRASCAVGSDMHIESDLRVYPCFATVQEAHVLGSLEKISLADFQRTSGFLSVLRQTVDDMEGCSICCWRYLCGGACRSWTHTVPNSIPVSQVFCQDRKVYAEGLLSYALSQLQIPLQQFEEIVGEGTT